MPSECPSCGQRHEGKCPFYFPETKVMNKTLINNEEEFLEKQEELTLEYKSNFYYGGKPETYPCVMITNVRDVSQGWEIKFDFVYFSDYFSDFETF